MDPLEAQPAREAAMQRAHTWARKAAEKAGLVKRPRAVEARGALEYERNLDTAARLLVRRLVLPGEWYLVRWGGTRKGAGTFYTRPGLSLPTIRRDAGAARLHPDADDVLAPKSHRDRFSHSRSAIPPAVPAPFPSARCAISPMPFSPPSSRTAGWSLPRNARPMAPSAKSSALASQPHQPASPVRDRLLAEVRAPRHRRRSPPARLPQAPRRGKLPLRRGPRPARHRTGPPRPLGRDDGPAPPLRLPRSQIPLRQWPRRRVARHLPALPGHGVETGGRGQG